MLGGALLEQLVRRGWFTLETFKLLFIEAYKPLPLGRGWLSRQAKAKRISSLFVWVSRPVRHDPLGQYARCFQENRVI